MLANQGHALTDISAGVTTKGAASDYANSASPVQADGSLEAAGTSKVNAAVSLTNATLTGQFSKKKNLFLVRDIRFIIDLSKY